MGIQITPSILNADLSRLADEVAEQADRWAGLVRQRQWASSYRV